MINPKDDAVILELKLSHIFSKKKKQAIIQEFLQERYLGVIHEFIGALRPDLIEKIQDD